MSPSRGPQGEAPNHEPVTHGVPASQTSVLRVRALRIEIVGGPDTGRAVHVDVPTFVIGSGPEADLRLSDTTVSREHVRLSLTPKGLHLRDDTSKNGTWIGEIRLRDAVLGADTTIELGTTKIALRLEAAPIDLPLSSSASFGTVIGVSPAMRHVFSILERATQSDITVLLEGESGVGKDVIARAIHAQSARSGGPFVAVDCGAMPRDLMESELFGHERGAFTGATSARQGVFEQAHEGTVFLDEIGELPLDLQPKLLRVLEQREVRPLGARAVRRIDVRVLAATNKRLAEAAEKNEFRRDLFYRLAVARVTIPPLRDRLEDILPLAGAFLRTAAKSPTAEVPADLAGLLRAYSWPGNVRELRNVIDRYALLGLRDAAGLFDAHSGASQTPAEEDLSHLPYHEARAKVLERFERNYLPKVLARANGVVSRAAELAEVARQSFHRMLERQRVPTSED